MALACYAHAQRNPRAIRYGQPLTREQYHASRWIAEPFHLYDCCPENDGAAAIVVTTPERAGDLAKPPVAIVAGAHGLGPATAAGPSPSRNFPTAFYREVAEQLWARAGCGPDDIDVAQLYENFTGQVLMTIARLRASARAAEAGSVRRGRHARVADGALPINTAGGNLAEAYIHGLSLVHEGVRQLRGESTCQVDGVELSLSVSGPGFAPGSAVLFGKG